jgi:hypothetical protein
MATHSEAILEANACCPPDEVLYCTLELEHPSFDQPVYVVANVADDIELGIEAGSDVNQGAMVNHVACPFKAEYPEQREGQPPQCKVSIDNVKRELLPKIRAALGVRAYVKVTYREYLGSDLSEPAYGPVQFILSKVTVKAATLTGTIMVGNLQNKRFPRADQNYNTTQFRSLLPG